MENILTVGENPINFAVFMTIVEGTITCEGNKDRLARRCVE